MRGYIQIFLFFFASCVSFGQNETTKWLFGNQAGLDFMTNPPSIITSSMTNLEGSASIADGAGNLLFYTNGLTVWTAAHTVMANGTGLMGNNSSSQSAMIAKQPGSSTLYYIFTLEQACYTAGLRYSIVDMSLASGAGSVTVKNVLLQTPSSEKITAVRHCNGIDTWIITHDCSSNNFRTFLLTSTGISTLVVQSAIGTSYSGTDFAGYMKTSPNGRKLAVNVHSNSFQVYDFDNSTGAVSNSLVLASGSDPYGAEFSPDGTKLYGATWFLGGGYIYQWDLCAGSPTVIVASQYTVCGTGVNKGGMQLANNGKIYVARYNTSWMGVIHNPNAAGAACSYTDQGQSISPKTNSYGMVNFMTSLVRPTPPPFTFTVSNSFGCQSAAFTTPAPQNYTNTNCAAIGYSVTGYDWNFGDPLSGSANTSTLMNPLHAFTNLGTYTVQLVINYSCGGGTDTIRQTVNINQPCITVTSNSITCANLGSATVSATGGIGPYSYTWMPGNQTTSVASNLAPGSYTITVFDFGNNFTYTALAVFNSVIPLSGNISATQSLACFGAANGTAAVLNLSGGTGNQNYLWTNGQSSYTVPNPVVLSGGLWSVTVTDALTHCQITDIFQILQPPPLTLQIASPVQSVCPGSAAVFSGLASGGTGPYAYQWIGGPAQASVSSQQAFSGAYVSTLVTTDANACTLAATATLNVMPLPTITVQDATICPQQTGTMQASGAASYTWNGGPGGSFYSASPATTTQYTVTGEMGGCISSATGSIIVKPVPSAQWSSSGAACNGQTLALFSGGGQSYVWSGPSFQSTMQNPVLSGVSPTQSGVYAVTVTAANGCTAGASGNVTVHPTPTVAANGGTVCQYNTLVLVASASGAGSFAWSGPAGFASSVQNPSLTNVQVSANGIYSVVYTESSTGCTNTATAAASVTASPVISLLSNSPRCEGDNLLIGMSGAPQSAQYAWSGPNSFAANVASPTLTSVLPSAAGVYSVQVVLGPCITGGSLSVVVFALPTPTIYNNGPVCEGASMTIGATGPASDNILAYAWNGPAGFNAQSSSTVIPLVTSGHAGTYQVTVTCVHGCKASATQTVGVLKVPGVSAAGTTVCLNSAASLTASGADSYYWIGPGITVNNAAQAVIASAGSLSEVAYQVIGTAANGCTATAFASLSTWSLPVPALSVQPSRTLCLNDVITLSGSGGVQYFWYVPNGERRSGATSQFPVSNFSYAGTYTLEVIDARGCRKAASTVININPLPQGSLGGGPKEGCAPFCGEYYLSALPVVKAQWEVNGRKMAASQFTACFNVAAEHTVRGTFFDSLTHCVANASFAITAHRPPRADFTWFPEQPVELMDEVVFVNATGGEGQTGWTWSFRGETTPVKGERVSRVFPDAGIFPVALTVRNIWGCADTVVKAVTILPDEHIYVPNVFTPDGNGLNDEFVAVTRGILKFRLQVFDRWGELVFEATSVTQGWNGQYRDEAAPQGVYTYKVDAVTVTGKPLSREGHVTLYR